MGWPPREYRVASLPELLDAWEGYQSRSETLLLKGFTSSNQTRPQTPEEQIAAMRTVSAHKVTDGENH